MVISIQTGLVLIRVNSWFPDFLGLEPGTTNSHETALRKTRRSAWPRSDAAFRVFRVFRG